jgi:hypothetical protein
MDGQADLRDALVELGARCSICHSDDVDGDAASWTLVKAEARKTKSARCLGYPMGWTLWVDGLRVSTIQRGSTRLCSSCGTSLKKRVAEETRRSNEESASRRRRHAKTAAWIALALLIPCLGIVGYYFSAGSPDSWKPAFWVSISLPALSGLWAVLTWFDTSEWIPEYRVRLTMKETLRAPVAELAGQYGIELVDGDEPTNLEQAQYIITEAVATTGERSGWTLFNCWGIIDEPGGTRREAKTTDWIRDNNTLHEDIGVWLARDD